MTKVVLAGLKPPQGFEFCAPCSLLYKTEVRESMLADIDALEQDGIEGVTKVLDMRNYEPPGTDRPAIAVTTAFVNGNPQFGALPVCWTHMMIVASQRSSGVAVANTGNVDQAVAAMGLMPASAGQRR